MTQSETDLAFSYVISLGDNCCVGKWLQRLRLKKQSYPFDWLFSRTDIVRDCLEDDFAKFLDKENYRAVKGAKKCKHLLYLPNGHMFNHYNPLAQEDHYTYYVRCVQRFRKVMQSDARKLFVRISGRIDELKNGFADVRRLCASLDQRTKNFTLVTIFYDATCPEPYERVVSEPNLVVYRFRTRTRPSVLAFVEPQENANMRKLMQEFRYDLKELVPDNQAEPDERTPELKNLPRGYV